MVNHVSKKRQTEDGSEFSSSKVVATSTGAQKATQVFTNVAPGAHPQQAVNLESVTIDFMNKIQLMLISNPNAMNDLQCTQAIHDEAAWMAFQISQNPPDAATANLTQQQIKEQLLGVMAMMGLYGGGF